jgi:hypothetical protein
MIAGTESQIDSGHDFFTVTPDHHLTAIFLWAALSGKRAS